MAHYLHCIAFYRWILTCFYCTRTFYLKRTQHVFLSPICALYCWRHYYSFWNPLFIPLRFALLYKSANIQLNHTRFGFFAPFVLGIGFSIGWSPCVGPILTSILTLSLLNPTHALWLMLCYCSGLGLAFLLVAIFVQSALRILKNSLHFYASWR